MEKENIPSENIEKLLNIYSFTSLNETTILFLKDLLINSEIGLKGVSEIEFMLAFISHSETGNLPSKIKLDLTLARGLDYYTGTIFEAKAPPHIKIGSIGAGGRYDDLTGLFGVPNISGIGISFGVDRIYDVLEELGLFPGNIHLNTQVLFFNLGNTESIQAFQIMQQLRNKGIRCELYHEQTKLDKQFKYADKKNITYAVIIGNKELDNNTCILKNLKNGEQQTMNTGEFLLRTF